MGTTMTTLHHRRLDNQQMESLIVDSRSEDVVLSDDHRRSLSARFRAVVSNEHRRLDAWSVEKAGVIANDFRWSPVTSRRTLGNAALRRIARASTSSVVDAVSHEVNDQLLRAVSGYARSGSMAQWLAQSPQPVIGLVVAEAVNWATQLREITERFNQPWCIAPNDAYYDVPSARTTLRARRDVIISSDAGRIVMRVRSGTPGKSAGPGLRADLTMETLADSNGVAPLRFIGLWPEAGVCLAVDGTMADLRAGARDLVRTAVVRQRHQTRHAA